MNLLVEVGCEELPVSYIEPALSHLREGLCDLLSRSGLWEGGAWRVFSTPRRLAVYLEGVAERQPDRQVERRGPSARAAFDAEGRPTKAAEGFARSCGVDVSQLKRRATDKGEYIFATVVEKARSASEIIADALPEILSSAPFPKTMRWGGGSFRFARPIRWLVALLGSEVIGLEIDGVRAGRSTFGHRFIGRGPIELPAADAGEYLRLLRDAGVIADHDERRRILADGVREVVARSGGSEIDEALADYVANLVEWPHPVEGAFDERFLSLPEEVLVESMRTHQHDFPVRDGSGRLVARFVCVRNGRPIGPSGDKLVRKGNEEVLRARFEDAVFFWEADRRRKMADRVEDLSGMVFQEGLGTYLDKTGRVVELATQVAAEAGVEDSESCRRAALLCKADLLTEMVGEFPRLQGIMGAVYLREEGEPELVWKAVRDQYLPDRVWGKEGVAGPAGTRLPETDTGAVLAIADKLDNIAGCFALGLRPSGSQDPYALRRQAAGVVSIVRGRGMSVGLPSLIDAAVAGVAGPTGCDRAETAAAMRAFFLERIKGAFRSEGIDYDIADAVLACGWDDVADAMARARALQRLRREDPAAFLAAAVVGERTSNILKGVDRAALGAVDPTLFDHPREGELYDLFQRRSGEVSEAVDRRDYESALRLFGSIFSDTVHLFFEDVLVNVEDETIRRNRLALNRLINELVGVRVADLSRLVITDEQRERAGGNG